MLSALIAIWIAAAAPPAHADSTAVNRFLWYDAAARTAHLQIVAAFDGTNGGMNFNGASNGGATITIPLGWRVLVAFVNRDAVPHSAIIIASGRGAAGDPGDARLRRRVHHRAHRRTLHRSDRYDALRRVAGGRVHSRVRRARTWRERDVDPVRRVARCQARPRTPHDESRRCSALTRSRS